jgi:hypothetical protein
MAADTPGKPTNRHLVFGQGSWRRTAILGERDSNTLLPHRWQCGESLQELRSAATTTGRSMPPSDLSWDYLSHLVYYQELPLLEELARARFNTSDEALVPLLGSLGASAVCFIAR